MDSLLSSKGLNSLECISSAIFSIRIQTIFPVFIGISIFCIHLISLKFIYIEIKIQTLILYRWKKLKKVNLYHVSYRILGSREPLMYSMYAFAQTNLVLKHMQETESFCCSSATLMLELESRLLELSSW